MGNDLRNLANRLDAQLCDLIIKTDKSEAHIQKDIVIVSGLFRTAVTANRLNGRLSRHIDRWLAVTLVDAFLRYPWMLLASMQYVEQVIKSPSKGASLSGWSEFLINSEINVSNFVARHVNWHDHGLGFSKSGSPPRPDADTALSSPEAMAECLEIRVLRNALQKSQAIMLRATPTAQIVGSTDSDFWWLNYLSEGDEPFARTADEVLVQLWTPVPGIVVHSLPVQVM